MRNVANRSILYQQFADGGAEEVGGIVPAPWMGIDEAELITLRNGPIAIGDTAYGRFEEQKKRDVERVYQKMTAAEKDRSSNERWRSTTRRTPTTGKPHLLPLPRIDNS
jgi:hypothetical protein